MWRALDQLRNPAIQVLRALGRMTRATASHVTEIRQQS
ncbi:hypothetical protein XAXN_01650 [Xanthomonas axonopodis]|uniref:Uncharacterized protein n=2 Tax=Xanthomonas axonopodis TaxID=53413 RepID=A0A098Q159_9XANT|nr:hypothetical protein GW15_0204200 [Xanthomonas axonopodis pv. vasculorum]KPL50378.1 hypothetical protein XAXN_01650 [Xanthomonas axonopodis]